MNDTRKEINAALSNLEYAGLIERTGEMRWSDRCYEFQPVYTLTELGRALGAAGVGFAEYLANSN